MRLLQSGGVSSRNVGAGVGGGAVGGAVGGGVGTGGVGGGDVGTGGAGVNTATVLAGHIWHAPSTTPPNDAVTLHQDAGTLRLWE